jgi:hypothetical protein
MPWVTNTSRRLRAALRHYRFHLFSLRSDAVSFWLSAISLFTVLARWSRRGLYVVGLTQYVRSSFWVIVGQLLAER